MKSQYLFMPMSRLARAKKGGYSHVHTVSVCLCVCLSVRPSLRPSLPSLPPVRPCPPKVPLSVRPSVRMNGPTHSTVLRPVRVQRGAIVNGRTSFFASILNCHVPAASSALPRLTWLCTHLDLLGVNCRVMHVRLLLIAVGTRLPKCI